MTGPGPEHDPKQLREDREHGQDWITCMLCGAQWNAASGEQVSEGDDYCQDTHVEA